jgi:5-oxopent-3-ene-1,2,5-tricarboxylate decarboxylase / 2-hydroxyhepta-2,4-diene-1,7-dioate isomerase
MTTTFDLPAMAALPTMQHAPWRLSGTVIGVLANDPAMLVAMGGAVNAPPYKAPPRAPVLYLKPRNTLVGTQLGPPRVPAGVSALEVGASLGIVIGRAARHVAAARALDHVAGWTLVVDLFVPHDDWYRPNVRLRALDGSCLVGPAVIARAALRDPDALTIDVQVGDAPPRRVTTAGMRRNVATLIQDVSEFMTLHAGDVLMLGARHAMPRVAAGQRLRVHADGLGTLEAEVGHDAERAA